MAALIREQEIVRKQILDEQVWQNVQSLQSSLSEIEKNQLLVDHTLKSQYRNENLQKQTTNLEALNKSWNNEVSWSMKLHQLQRENVKNLFSTLKQAIAAKEEEVLAALDLNEKTFAENTSARTQEIKALQQDISSFLKLPQEESSSPSSPEILRDQFRQLNAKIHQLSSFQSNDVLISDYGFTFEFPLKSALKSIDSIHPSNKSQIFRWKIYGKNFNYHFESKRITLHF